MILRLGFLNKQKNIIFLLICFYLFFLGMDTIMHQQQYADFASEYGVGGMGSEMARNTQQERKLVNS